MELIKANNFELELLFEPRDLWLGVYWDRQDFPPLHSRFLYIYICIIPVLPIKVTLAWEIDDYKK